MAYTQFFDLKERIYDYFGNQLDTTVFFIYYPSHFNFLRSKLEKVCDSFQTERLDMPGTKDEILQGLRKTKVNLDNLYNTLLFTLDNFKKYLVTIHHNRHSDGFSIIKVYKQYLKKNKCIFYQLNKMR